MNKLYIIFFCSFSITISYSNASDNSGKNLGLISTKLIKQIQNLENSPNEINKFKKIIEKKSSCIVLIYTISDKAKLKNKKKYFYNSAIQPRTKSKDYKYGVTCGVILSQDGIVVTTYDGTVNSDRYIVAIDSEKNQDDELYGEIKLNNNTYKAHVIKSLPSLNLVFLQIETNKSEKFDFLNLASSSEPFNKNDGSSYLMYSAVAIGKCKGEHFVKQRQTYNAKNKFDIVSNIIGFISFNKIKGVPTLVLYTPTTGDGSIPENHGGAILDGRGKLLGIPVWKDSLNLPFSFAIPSSTIKLGLGIILPTIIKNDNGNSIGLELKHLNTVQKKLLKKALRDSTKLLNDAFLNNLKKSQVSTNFDNIQDFIDNNNFGVAVYAIKEGSLADNANILVGDILLQFNDDCILDEETFNNLEAYSINEQQITLTLLREGKIIELNLLK